MCCFKRKTLLLLSIALIGKKKTLTWIDRQKTQGPDELLYSLFMYIVLKKLYCENHPYFQTYIFLQSRVSHIKFLCLCPRQTCACCWGLLRFILTQGLAKLKKSICKRCQYIVVILCKVYNILCPRYTYHPGQSV